MAKNNDLLTLKEAVEQYKQEEKAASNSYDWYRKQAQRYGKTFIGDKGISATKENGVWYVNKAEFSEAINQHRLPSLVRQGDIHKSLVTAIALGCNESILPHSAD